MNAKSVLIAGVSVVALTGALFAFLANSSPYVTVAQAKTSQGDSLYLAGDIHKDTVQINPAQRECSFVIEDENGETIQVVATGVPANLGEATQAVAVGKVEGDVFKAHTLKLKCPSKYESEEGQGTEVAAR